MSDKLRKFLSFEWLMLVMFGIFWSTAMYLPLLCNRFFDTKIFFWLNLLIMFGPYSLYLTLRSIYLLYRSLRWAYLMSNFFFSSEWERRLADEWFIFILFGVLWSLIIVFPLYVTGMFIGQLRVLAVSIMVAPYVLSVIIRLLVASVKICLKSLEVK